MGAVKDGSARASAKAPVAPARSTATTAVPAAHEQVLELQRTAGNAAVTAMLQRTEGSTLTAVGDGDASARRFSAGSEHIAVAGTRGVSAYQALKALHLQAGKNVVAMGSHEWKVERYGRFLEGDDIFVREQRGKLLSALAEESVAEATLQKAPPKKQAALSKTHNRAVARVEELKAVFAHEQKLDIDADVADIETDPMAVADKSVARADDRVAKGMEAQSRMSAEKPVVGFAYDETKKHLAEAESADPEKLKVGGATSETTLGELEEQRRAEVMKSSAAPASFGAGGAPAAPAAAGRFARWQRGRATKAASADAAKRATTIGADIEKRKLANRFPQIVDAGQKAATPLVQQSILSEQVVAVKRLQLKAMKATVKKFERGTTLGKHIGNKVTSGIAGGLLSAFTFGAVDVDARKTQGGYKSQRRFVTPWTRFKEDLAALRRLAAERPHGAFNSAYTLLKGFNELVVKQIRNLFGGLATTFGLLGLIPGAQALLGIAAICGVVSIAAGALKLLVDATLTTWNAVATARNDNAYNSRHLQGELMSTGLDTLGSAMRVGGAFAGPLAANAAYGAAGSEARISNPLEMAGKVGGIDSTGALGGVKSLENGVRNPYGQGDASIAGIKVENPLAYMQQQGIKGAGLATSAGSNVAGKIAGAVSGTEGLGAGARAKLEHDDRDQWESESSAVRGARGKARGVPIGEAGTTLGAELEKEAAVKNAARAAQGRWAKEQGVGVAERITAVQERITQVAGGAATAAPAAAKDGPEASADASGASSTTAEAAATMAVVAGAVREGAEDAGGR